MFLNYRILSFAWALIILVLTLVPGNTVPTVPIFGIDKLVHFLIFGLLMFLTLNALKKQQGIGVVVLSYVFCISYGAIIEVLQNFIPGRSFSLFDILANTIGVLLGYFAFILISKK